MTALLCFYPPGHLDLIGQVDNLACEMPKQVRHDSAFVFFNGPVVLNLFQDLTGQVDNLACEMPKQVRHDSSLCFLPVRLPYLLPGLIQFFIAVDDLINGINRRGRSEAICRGIGYIINKLMQSSGSHVHTGI